MVLIFLTCLAIPVRAGYSLTKNRACLRPVSTTSDKYVHFLAGAALTAVARERGGSRGNCLIVVGSAGLAKELFDWLAAGKKVDLADLFFDLLGATVVLAF